MEFCPECGAMLLPKDGILKCNSCGHEKNLSDNNEYEVSEDIKESDNVKIPLTTRPSGTCKSQSRQGIILLVNILSEK